MSAILRLAGIAVALSITSSALAADVTVVGLFPNKAVVQIDGGAMRTLSVGQKTAEGVVLVSVDRDTAVFEIDGKRVSLGIGQARLGRSAPAASSVTLTADTRGHFSANGQINGQPVQFVVDTGATLVALPSGEARRLGIDFTKGQRAGVRTASGSATGYLVKLDTISVGSVMLYGIDAVVIEGAGLATPLLGMSFLNRMNMKREGDIMTLTSRF
jgi:aspartyl protease family protein